MTDVEVLRNEWVELYSQILPRLAKSRDPVQKKWPVSLDHCFARIILDNAIGNGQQQWDKVLKKPAIKHMTVSQFRDAIALGGKIWSGEVDLTELDRVSLQCRGKGHNKYGTTKRETNNRGVDTIGKISSSKKRKLSHDISNDDNILRLRKSQSKLSFEPAAFAYIKDGLPQSTKPRTTPVATPDQIEIVHRIRSHGGLTPYRKRLYSILLSVPRGRHTTYAVMSEYLDSSARAVGNGMRNNPFAPEVPCHRVLAADGSLGGFGGYWGKDGKYADKKVNLLRSEGVRFDTKGKVIGEPFRNFHEFEDVG